MEKKGKSKHAQLHVGKIEKCRIPERDEWVYDYYIQELKKEEEQEFEDHLFECDRCQDILLMLDAAYTQMRINTQPNAGANEGKVKKKRAKGANCGE